MTILRVGKLNGRRPDKKFYIEFCKAEVLSAQPGGCGLGLQLTQPTRKSCPDLREEAEIKMKSPPI